MHVEEPLRLLFGWCADLYRRCERLGFTIKLCAQSFNLAVLLSDEIASLRHQICSFEEMLFISEAIEYGVDIINVGSRKELPVIRNTLADEFNVGLFNHRNALAIAK